MKLLSLTLFFCLALLASPPASARTWYIKLDGSGDAPTIQAGIDSAAVGDSVILEGGTWHVHDINMKAGICLVGEGGMADFVTLSADGLGQCLNCSELGIPTTISGITQPLFM